jgi:hypothetical protein
MTDHHVLISQLLQPHIMLSIVIALAKTDIRSIVSLSLVSKQFHSAMIFENRRLLRPLIRIALSVLTPLVRARLTRQHGGDPKKMAIATLRHVHRKHNAIEQAEQFLHLRVRLWHMLTVVLKASGVESSCRHLNCVVEFCEVLTRKTTARFSCRSCGLQMTIAGPIFAEFGFEIVHQILPWNVRVLGRYAYVNKIGIRGRRTRHGRWIDMPKAMQLRFTMHRPNKPDKKAIVRFGEGDGRTAGLAFSFKLELTPELIHRIRIR